MVRRRFVLLVAVASLLAAVPLGVADSQSLAGKRIAIDAGHGGTDGGSSGSGLVEKDINLDVARRARDLLTLEGATVTMTRDCDCAVTLAARVAAATTANVDRFLSVHANTCGGCGGKGTETYYHTSLTATSTSAKLAALVQQEVVSKLGTNDRGLKQADFYVLRETPMPAVLVELGFLDDAGDAAKLGSAQGRQDAARALLHAVQRHYGIAAHDPSTAFAVSIGSPSSAGWLRGEVSAVGTSNQEGNLNWMRFLVDGAVTKWVTPTPHAWTWDTAAFPDGERELRLEARNLAGDMAIASRQVRIDNTAPSTTASLAGTPGTEGWYRSAVSAAIACADAASGCAATTLRLDGAPVSGSPVSIAAQGVHGLDLGSSDLAGNVEATHALTIKVDSVAPSTTASATGTAGNAGWYRSAVTVALACTDATSGCAAPQSSLDGAAFAPGASVAVDGEGSHALKFFGLDRAGNVEAQRSLALRIDTVPPATGAIASGPLGEHGWFRGPVAVDLPCADATSGCAATRFALDGSGFEEGNALDIGGDGLHFLARLSSDVAGNEEPLQTSEVRIDGTPPLVELLTPAAGRAYLMGQELPVPALPMTLVIGALDVRVRASDATSGVDRAALYVDGALRATATAAPWTLAWDAGSEAAGEHDLEVVVHDAAGNAASATLLVTTVPSTPAGLAATVGVGA